MALNLYNVTVQTPSAINASEVCLFSQDREFLVLAKGQWLEVYTIEDGELYLKSKSKVFASIRAMKRICTPGSAIDTLGITSDSGDFVILEYEPSQAIFKKRLAEPIGRSGLRRTIPGEYLAIDPKGRVAMVAGIEKLRLIYVLHSDGLGSTIEAHAPSTFCYELIAMDRGYANPAFATLERFRFGSKTVAMYELNLGLNHLIKLWSSEVSDETDTLVALPGGRDGPSGLVAFSNDKATYLQPANGQAKYAVDLPMPVVTATIVRGRSPHDFFIVAQMVNGECLKLSLNDNGLSCSRLAEFPRALELRFIQAGYLFFNSESGDHILAEIAGFEPVRLEETSSLHSIAPSLCSLLRRKELVVANGLSNDARISRLEFGKEIEELVSSELPATTEAVYSTGTSASEKAHRLIALSFETTTTFLSVKDDGSVSETSEGETGLNSGVKTLGIQMLGDALVQVHHSGIRFVLNKTPTPWLAPKGVTVTACAFSPSQVLLILDDAQVVYFELQNGVLVESSHRIELPSRPTAICFEGVAGFELRARHLFVACEDETVRMFTTANLKQQKLYKTPSLVVSMYHSKRLHLGHANGMYSHLHGDKMQTRVLGSGPIKLVSLAAGRLLAIASRTWVILGDEAVPLIGATSAITAACSFNTEDLEDGVLGIRGPSLLVFSITDTRDGSRTVQRAISLPSTASRLARNTLSDYGYAAGSSAISVIDLAAADATNLISSVELESPCHACTNVRFDSIGKEVLVVATKLGIKTFEYHGSPAGSHLQLLHDTPVIDCSALMAFKGALLAAVGKTHLVLYDIGKRQLLRKSEIHLSQLTFIKELRASRDRIYVGDSRNSVTVVRYGISGFDILFTDSVSRSVTALLLLDHATVCIGDQYGNLTVLRCPNTRESKAVCNYLEFIAHCSVSDGIVSLQRGALSPVSGTDAIVYIGIQGTIGSLIPFSSVQEAQFFQQFEAEANSRLERLASSGPLTPRGTPAKSIVDGDLCELAATTQSIKDSDLQEIATILETDVFSLRSRITSFRDRSVI